MGQRRKSREVQARAAARSHRCSQTSVRARRWVLVTVFSALSIGGLIPTAAAQKIYSVGLLNTGNQFTSAFEGFKDRMVALGYRDKLQIQYHYYSAKGQSASLALLAQKLAQSEVDLIVTSSTSATVAAVQATEKNRIPVLFLSAGNAEKLVKTYSGSGINLAGISSASMELVEKRFELLRELAPTTKRLAVLQYPAGVNYKANVAGARDAAQRLGFKLWEIHVASVQDIDHAAQEIHRGVTDAIFSPPEALITSGIEILIRQAIKEKLPLITSLLVNVKQGCLATYAADYRALGQQGAALADKILKGANPGSLPVEMPDKINLVLNLRTAKAIDLKIPRELLLRADDVFE